MAKNIVLRRFNGTGFDISFPKTIVGQVDGLKEHIEDLAKHVTASEKTLFKRYAILDVNTMIDTTNLNKNMIAINREYATIDAILADIANIPINGLAMVLDATKDITVQSGWAIYRKIGTNADITSLQKISEKEQMDIIWSINDIKDKYTSTSTQVDGIVTNDHTHTNKAMLDALTDNRLSIKAEDVDNIITTDDSKISSLVANTNDMIFCMEYKGIPLTDSKYKLKDIYPSTYQTMTTVPDKLDTSKVTNMGYMFTGCSAITSIPQLDTSKVTDMSQMFYNCTAITSIPQLDTSKVTDMGGMFINCRALTSVPQLDTSKVTNMSSMFINCNAITSIPQLDTSKVTDMYGMFTSCKSLPEEFPWVIDCSSIDSVPSSMFRGSSVKKVTFKNVKNSIKSEFTKSNLGAQLTSINFI